MSNKTAIRAAESDSFEDLPFVGKGSEPRSWWAVPGRGGYYAGGDMAGAAAAMAYLKFLHDDNGQRGFLQNIQAADAHHAAEAAKQGRSPTARLGRRMGTQAG